MSTGSIFVLAISRLLPAARPAHRTRQALDDGRRRFGLAAALSVVVLGDESGYTTTDNQKMKLAAIEAMWNTEPAPAPLHRFRHSRTRRRVDALRDQDSLGARPDRHALDRPPVPGIFNWSHDAKARIHSGMIAYAALQKLRADPQRRAPRADGSTTHAARSRLCPAAEALCRRSAARRRDAADRSSAAWTPCPMSACCSGRFRFMVGARLYLHRAVRRRVLSRVDAGSCDRRRVAAADRVAVACRCPGSRPNSAGSSPKYGRQPWIIEGVLPTFLAVSSLPAAQRLDQPHRLRRCSIPRCSSSNSI